LTGRHAERSRRGRRQVALAIAGGGVVTVAAVVTLLATVAWGGPPPRPRADPAAHRAATPRVVTSSPSTTPSRPARHSDPLGRAAASWVASRSGTVLAAVYDVKTGQTWNLGHGQPQPEASVVKLDILETLLAQRGGAGLTAADRTLAEEMIEDSDNDAATDLWEAVGYAGGIRAYNATAGLSHTTPSACVNCPSFAWPGWGLSTTVPADQITLLRRLVQPSPVLTTAERRYALSLMENVTPSQRWGVSGGVPAQATVALKNGWLPLNSAGTDWQINSVGWVDGLGRDYLMAVLTTGNPDEQYGIDTIGQLAAQVWAGMG
jgi:beta-lactamase class A